MTRSAQLRKLSLIRLDEESLQCHKLVLDCTRSLLSEELRRESLAATLEWLSGSLPKADYTEAGWNLWKRLAPHVAAIQKYGIRDPRYLHLLEQCARWPSNFYYMKTKLRRAG